MEEDSTRLITDAFLEASRGTLVERMGITISEASAERVVGMMPVAGNTQPYGLLHGGASCVLAETLGSLGSALHAGLDRVTMGIEISATHHRAATGGTVTGVATRLHGGRTITTYEIVVSDEAGRRVCTARLTCLLSDRVPGAGRRADASAAVAAMLSTAPGNAGAGGRASGAGAAGTAGSPDGARTAEASGKAGADGGAKAGSGAEADGTPDRAPTAEASGSPDGARTAEAGGSPDGARTAEAGGSPAGARTAEAGGGAGTAQDAGPCGAGRGTSAAAAGPGSGRGSG